MGFGGFWGFEGFIPDLWSFAFWGFKRFGGLSFEGFRVLGFRPDLLVVGLRVLGFGFWGVWRYRVYGLGQICLALGFWVLRGCWVL